MNLMSKSVRLQMRRMYDVSQSIAVEISG